MKNFCLDAPLGPLLRLDLPSSAHKEAESFNTQENFHNMPGRFPKNQTCSSTFNSVLKSGFIHWRFIIYVMRSHCSNKSTVNCMPTLFTSSIVCLFALLRHFYNVAENVCTTSLHFVENAERLNTWFIIHYSNHYKGSTCGRGGGLGYE